MLLSTLVLLRQRLTIKFPIAQAGAKSWPPKVSLHCVSNCRLLSLNGRTLLKNEKV